MNDDELLESLGAQHRAEVERRAPEWEELARGRRSAKDAADTVQARTGADAHELSRATELFAPLSDAFDDALVERLAATPASDRHDTGEPGPGVIERRDRSFWRRGGIAVAIAAAAAALVLVLARPGSAPGPSGDLVAQRAELPVFELALTAARATVRADHGAHGVQVAAGDVVELMLRPASRHPHAARVWSCLERDGTRTELPTQIVDAAAGATILARATIPEGTSAGTWSLVAVVAVDPPEGEPCSLADAPTHRVLRSPITVAPRR